MHMMAVSVYAQHVRLLRGDHVWSLLHTFVDARCHCRLNLVQAFGHRVVPS